MVIIRVLAGAGLFVLGTLLGWALHDRADNETHQLGQGMAVDSIVLTRSAGFGPGPNYTITFTEHGHVLYRGFPSLDTKLGLQPTLGREGVYVGRIDRSTFARLASMAGQLGLRERNEPFVPDIDTGYTLLTVGGSAEHATGAAAPLIEAIDSVLKNIAWRGGDRSAWDTAPAPARLRQ